MILQRSFLVGCLLACAVSGAGPAAAGSLSSGLARQLAERDPDQPLRVLVVLRDQLDLRALDRTLHAEKAALPRRHHAVVAGLRNQAATGQRDLLAALAAKRATGRILGYTSHWLINAVVVTADAAAIAELAARPDVLRVEADLVPRLIAPVATWRPTGKAAQGVGLAPGVAAIGAPRVWRELGLDGTGSLVGIIDTGVDAGHPSLAARWRGNFTAAQYAWLDAGAEGSPDLPIDVDGHGTHVLGTVTGLAPDDTIGVAPGAQWIAANGIEKTGSALDNAVLAALEFMTDPDGDPATTADVPDVVQNSWGVSEAMAGYLDCDSRWWDLIDNCEAAGVVLLWAAGNEGAGGVAGTVRSPADRADSPTNCFAVGATSNHAPFLISDFSSRGPSGCGGPYAVKPELTAPGDTIYSALAGGGYTFRSGTSMAGPHVAGVVALMRQANPDVDVVTIKEILLATAQDLGPAGEDNTYGHGFLDAFAAVSAVLTGIGTVTGTVTDASTGLPVADARLQLDGGFNLAYGDSVGVFSLTMAAGPASFTVTAFGYFDGALAVEIPDGGSVNGDVPLTARPVATLSGQVRGPGLLPVAGAHILVQDTPLPVVQTDTAGFYSVALPAGPGQTYTVRASAPGLGYEVATFVMAGDLTRDFTLPELTWEDFESGGFVTYPWQFGGDAPWLTTTDSPYEGTFCASSAPIVDNQTAELRLDYYVAAAGELRFRYRVSSEPGFDFLSFLIDDVPAGSWSGEVGWSLFRQTIPAGPHTFVWRYGKDEVIAAGADRAWLDFVELPQAGTGPAPDLDFSPPELALGLAPGMVTTRTVILANLGTADLSYALTVAPVAAAVPDWVSVSPASGILGPGESVPAQVRFDATTVGVGSYAADLVIDSNDSTSVGAQVSLQLGVGSLSDAPPDLPHRLRFTGAVPNPFNPRTTIRYALPRAGRVTLVIHDLRGHEVRRLVDAEQAAGNRGAVWDGRDDRGREVSSGTYFARLVFGHETRVRTMALVR